jgi:uroporphyrinogen decarboxylase
VNDRVTRRTFVASLGMTAAAAAGAGAAPTRAASGNKREAMLSFKGGGAGPGYVPAAFFLHFGEDARFGKAAIEKHLEYYRFTGMDFVKIQYERTFPPLAGIKAPTDWKSMPRYGLDFYRPQLEVIDALVRAKKDEALVLVTLYSPFMCAGHTVGRETLVRHLEADGAAVDRGLDTVTASVLEFVAECRNLGVDGFYASTQGGEAGTFRDPGTFAAHVKPHDLRVQREIDARFAFNILHVCDFEAPYADYAAFTDYPGHVVSCSPHLKAGTLSLRDVARHFGRPVIGGMDRKGVLSTGSNEEVGREAEKALRDAPERFVLGADCTIPGDGRWEAVRTAIAVAHAYRRG